MNKVICDICETREAEMTIEARTRGCFWFRPREEWRGADICAKCHDELIMRREKEKEEE